MSPAAAPARIVFADGDPALRELLRTLLGLLPHVTVVGEAGDGLEAVRMVAQHYPDTVLLDVNLPNLDGFAVAEVIRSFRPGTRLLLHTAEISDERRLRAKRLGIPLLDKMRLSSTMDFVEEAAVAADHSLAFDIEPLVLLALAGRANEGVLVVKADQSVPFYNPAFASALDLPFPADSVTLDDLYGRGLARRADRSVLHLDEQPIVIAMTEKKSVTAAVFLCVPDGELRPYTMTCVPFFGTDGELIGVANYVTEAGTPGKALASDDPLLASLGKGG